MNKTKIKTIRAKLWKTFQPKDCSQTGKGIDNTVLAFKTCTLRLNWNHFHTSFSSSLTIKSGLRKHSPCFSFSCPTSLQENLKTVSSFPNFHFFNCRIFFKIWSICFAYFFCLIICHVQHLVERT